MPKISKNNSKKIIVALSGGVDSAVAAALLKKQGYEVAGVYFHLGGGENKGLSGAKKIGAKLGIPLKIFYAQKEFRKKVIHYFVESYRKGITPNPCVVCNKEIKFQLLFDLMRKSAADYVATGHYARVKRERKARKEFIYKLLQAKDKTKDQSYFLYRLTQKDLAKIIFPLGEYGKSDVKKIAKKMKLPVLEDESQDICFIENNDVRKYLSRNVKLRLGNIVDEKKNILAKHKGLPLYTIGQRKGIGIGPPASRQGREAMRSGGTKPYYVVKKNLKKNELVVTNNPKKLLKMKFQIGKINWVNPEIKLPLWVEVQVRYHSKRISAKILSGRSGRLLIETKKPLRAVTAGQSAVFYRGIEVLGGGIITTHE